MAKTDLPILEQRRIEANIIKPIFAELKSELGETRARQLLETAIEKDALAQGRAYAEEQSDPTNLTRFHALLPQWTANGALEIESIESTETTLNYNVTRCRYAEMYKEMGLSDIGHILSCGRDGTFCKGYDARIELSRSQTIMQGASHCDFRHRYKPT